MEHLDFNKKISVREVFGRTLVELGQQNSDIVVLDSDLACSTQTKFFKAEFPKRFFDCGIAEQNMVTTAAGLALTGKIPFVATFAVFATGRTYDQIRSSVCYQNANVKIVGTHCGVTVGEDGATHQALEDVGLMRALPNMTVLVPSDSIECKQIVEYAASVKTPVYIRISRNNLPDIHSVDYKFNPNKAEVLKDGKDLTIIANGDILQEVIKASYLLKEKGYDAEIINVPVIKPFDKDTIIESARRTKFVVTVENHSINNGLGSAVCEALSENLPTKVLRIGVNNEFGQSGTPSELLKYYKLDSDGIVNRILSEI